MVRMCRELAPVVTDTTRGVLPLAHSADDVCGQRGGKVGYIRERR